MFQVPSAQPQEHLGDQVRHFRGRKSDVVRERVELALEQPLAGGLDDLLVEDLGTAEERRAGPQRHQPGRPEQGVFVGGHPPRVEEPSEHRLLVDVNRRRGIRLRQPQHFVDGWEKLGLGPAAAWNSANDRSERGPGSYGRYSSSRRKASMPSAAACSIVSAVTPLSSRAVTIFTASTEPCVNPPCPSAVSRPRPASHRTCCSPHPTSAAIPAAE